MPEEIRRRAFEPFVTTRAKGQAAGLGLTMVHSIVQLHRGQILLESTEDIGTKVTIWLPSHSINELLQIDRAGAPSERAATAIPGVLLVGCEPFIAEAIKAYLQRVPLDVMIASDTEEGLKCCERWPGRFKAIVSELATAKTSGLEFLEALRKRDVAAPVFLLGSNEDGSGRVSQIVANGEGHVVIARPFPLRALKEAICSPSKTLIASTSSPSRKP
jgi:two-component system, cell cycle sensor histidine kinase and response regulator CckA